MLHTYKVYSGGSSFFSFTPNRSHKARGWYHRRIHLRPDEIPHLPSVVHAFTFSFFFVVRCCCCVKMHCSQSTGMYHIICMHVQSGDPCTWYGIYNVVVSRGSEGAADVTNRERFVLLHVERCMQQAYTHTTTTIVTPSQIICPQKSPPLFVRRGVCSCVFVCVHEVHACSDTSTVQFVW